MPHQNVPHLSHTDDTVSMEDKLPPRDYGVYSGDHGEPSYPMIPRANDYPPSDQDELDD